MKDRSIGEVIDSPRKQWIPEAHLGVEFDYYFMGKGMGKTGVHLFIETAFEVARVSEIPLQYSIQK